MKTMRFNYQPLRILLVGLLTLSIFCGIIFRTIQLFCAIDYQTGFYKEWNFSLPALDITLFTATIVIFILVFFLKRVPIFTGVSKRGVGISLLSLLCAAGMIGQMILQILQTQSWSILMLISVVLSSVSFFCFLILGIREFLSHSGSGTSLFRNTTVTLWCCAEMLWVFFDHSSKSNTSEYVFVILFLYFATLFFVKFGKLAFYDSPTYASTFSLFASSSLMSLFGFVLSVPNIIAGCCGIASWQSLSPFSCVAFPFAIYGLFFVCSNCLNLSQNKRLNI